MSYPHIRPHSLSYYMCQELLGDKRQTRQIGNNTYLRREPTYHSTGSQYVIRYHDTDVITFYPSGSVLLRDGGYRSYTTKVRLNWVAGVIVYQDKHTWYVQTYLPVPHLEDLGQWQLSPTEDAQYSEPFEWTGTELVIPGTLE